jgi:anti-anti-sigma regulatory factor
MMEIRVENLDDLVLIECKGRFVRSDTVFQLRDVVMAQHAAIVVLDLSEVEAMGGGGVGMLKFLEHWAQEQKIHLKLFNPSKAVVEGLVLNRCILDFEIAGFHEMMGILAHGDSRYSLAA